MIWMLVTSLLASAQEARLEVGHWVRIKGAKAGPEGFTAQEIEVREPGELEELIGTVEAARVTADGEAELLVLGQRVRVSERTELEGVAFAGLEALVGGRVEVEGYWRGLSKLSARELKVRTKGRDRVEGRIDAIEQDGDALVLSVMRWRVRLPADVEVQSDAPLERYARAPARARTQANEERSFRRRDDDDELGGRELAPNLYGGLRLEWRRFDEDEYDLDDSDMEDRRDDEFNARGELVWAPHERFYGLLGYRHSWRVREDDADGRSHREQSRINEAYGYFRDVGVKGLDLQLGRQDFDEEREWLYDENLDAARLILRRWGLRFELAAATILSDGNERDENTDTLIALVETEFQPDQRYGAYAIQRDEDVGVGYQPLHLGLRAYGQFWSGHESWGELSFLSGDRGGLDVTGWAFDLGTTWSPEALDDWYFTAGLAMGSGDADLSDGEDGTFRQTGLQDNNAKLGGVTSFRYYGELLDPELANLQIATLGIGKRFGKKNSVDLVYHQYRQVEAFDRLVDTQLDRRPDGIHEDLGWELDLIFGSRAHPNLDVECVLGKFGPGAAFPDADDAWLFKVQLRLKL